MRKKQVAMCKKHVLFRNRFGQLECMNCNYILMKKEVKEPKQDMELIISV